MEYVAANGATIADSGEKPLTFGSNDGGRGSVRSRLANVTEPLRPVSSVCDRGNRSVFDSEESYVDPKSSGERIPPRRQNGAYVMDAWVGGFLGAGVQAVRHEVRKARVVSGPRDPSASERGQHGVAHPPQQASRGRCVRRRSSEDAHGCVGAQEREVAIASLDYCFVGKEGAGS